jgi:cell wall-associated NlpC family hydrolase
MAKGTDEKIGYRKLLPGDLMFFAPKGRDAKAAEVYHVGIYIGKGWMIDSSGSQAGVSLSEVANGAWWHDQFAWGRRIIDA